MTLEQFLSWQWIQSGAWVGALGRFSAAVLIIVAGFFIAGMASKLVGRLKGRAHISTPSVYIVQKLVSYAVVLLAVLIGLSTMGINLTSLAVFAGAIGVGVGLGLQGVVREFVSGLVAIFDPLVRVGDYVELENGVKGTIVEIGPRASRIRTNSSTDVVLPNSKLIENQVTNWVLRGETRSITVPFTVAYGVDKAKVRDAVIAAAKAVPFTLPDTDNRKTQVWLTGFGDSALEFALIVSPNVDAVRRPAAMNAAYAWAIDDALRAADIEMPFPQMDLRIRSLFGREGDEALNALAQKPSALPGRRESAVGPNDAADEVMRNRDEAGDPLESHRRRR